MVNFASSSDERRATSVETDVRENGRRLPRIIDKRVLIWCSYKNWVTALGINSGRSLGVYIELLVDICNHCFLEQLQWMS